MTELGRARAFYDTLSIGEIQFADNNLQEILALERDIYQQRQRTRDLLQAAKANRPDDEAYLINLENNLNELEKQYETIVAELREKKINLLL